MKIAEQLEKVRFNGTPECLIKLCWESIRSWCLVVLHLENWFLNFILRIGKIEKVIFLNGNLGYISVV
jgi:hypothetical protein